MAKKASKKAVKKANPRVVKSVKKAGRRVAPGGDGAFKLTYATMFDPPLEMHTRFEAALAKVKSNIGKDHGMLINGRDRFVEAKFEDRSPINAEWLLGTFQK